MIPTAILLAAVLAATPTLVDERPLWAGSFRPAAEVVLVAAVPGGLGARSATSTVVIPGDVSAALGAGLCSGTDPRLAIPAGRTLFLLGPGSPASLVATVSLPTQAVSAAVPVVTSERRRSPERRRRPGRRIRWSRHVDGGRTGNRRLA